ncbi:hypothetical protein D3C72_1649570 [compost metagenome]
MQVRRREAVAQRVIGRVHGHQLAEDVRRQFADDEAMAGQHGDQIVAVLLAVRGLRHVEQARIPGGNLQGLEAHAGRPCGDGWQGVEGRRVGGELGQVQARSLDGFHIGSYCLSIDKE